MERKIGSSRTLETTSTPAARGFPLTTAPLPLTVEVFRGGQAQARDQFVPHLEMTRMLAALGFLSGRLLRPAGQGYSEETMPQAKDQFEPFFGDNTCARRAQLLLTTAPPSPPDSYSEEARPQAKDQFDPYFGDNTYVGARSSLLTRAPPSLPGKVIPRWHDRSAPDQWDERSARAVLRR